MRFVEIAAAVVGLWSFVGGVSQVSERGCYCVAPWQTEYPAWFVAPVRPVDAAHDGICSGRAWDLDCRAYSYEP
ncbi:hypothetical protein [Streptomyces melanogenes]|uniref:hypothetical protein n=1 Tax=Streptomyces melanogenes TaxID=67326 RepID=UPI0037902FFB